jgi:hypothetical protein
MTNLKTLPKNLGQSNPAIELDTHNANRNYPPRLKLEGGEVDRAVCLLVLFFLCSSAFGTSRIEINAADQIRTEISQIRQKKDDPSRRWATISSLLARASEQDGIPKDLLDEIENLGLSSYTEAAFRAVLELYRLNPSIREERLLQLGQEQTQAAFELAFFTEYAIQRKKPFDGAPFELATAKTVLVASLLRTRSA